MFNNLLKLRGRRFVIGRVEQRRGKPVLIMSSSDAELPYVKRVRVDSAAQAAKALADFRVQIIMDSGDKCGLGRLDTGCLVEGSARTPTRAWALPLAAGTS